jgi:hypothetical protein
MRTHNESVADWRDSHGLYQLRVCPQSIVLRVTICVAFALVAPATYAQRQIPNNSDLLAAYCVAIFQSRLATVSQYVASDRPDHPESLREVQRSINELVANFKVELARLQGYLSRRMQMLEPTALAEAHAAGTRDLSQSEREGSECTRYNKCNEITYPDSKDLVKCAERCFRDNSPAQVRIRRCDDPRVLPY